MTMACAPPTVDHRTMVESESGSTSLLGAPRVEPSGFILREGVMRRDAMICIGGLSGGAGASLAEVARRLAVAFDNASPSRLGFRAEAEHTKTHAGRKYQMVTIVRVDGAEETPVVDLFEFDYRDALAGELKQKSPPAQIWSISVTLFLNTWTLLRAMTRRSQSFAQKAQVFYGASLFSVTAVYVVLLVATLVLSLSQLSAESTSGVVSPDALLPEQVKALFAHISPRLLTLMQTGVVTVALCGLFTRFNMKEALAAVAPALASATAYLSTGAHRTRLAGELLRLIDCLDEQSEVPYERVHLLSYSFGSIVAIDTLFSQEAAPSRKLERVHSLITIGCPFDFVRTYFPTYFQQRRGLSQVPRRWLNVYAEFDVLGSNFLDEVPGSLSEQAGVEAEQEDGLVRKRFPAASDNLAFGPTRAGRQSWLDWAGFLGFRAHSTYWDARSEIALSCFEQIVEKMYGGTPATTVSTLVSGDLGASKPLGIAR